MGFRHYFFLIEKERVESLKSLTIDDIKKDYMDDDFDDLVDLNKIVGNERVFEFGKLYWCDTTNRITSKATRLFDDDFNSIIQDYDVYIGGKDMLIESIESIKDLLVKYKQNLLKKKKVVIKSEIESELRYIESKHFINYNNNYSLTGSCLYEHVLFNLIFLLKTLDFEKYDLAFVGY